MAERAVMHAQSCARQIVSAYVTEHVYTGLVTHMEIADRAVMQLRGGRANGAEKHLNRPPLKYFGVGPFSCLAHALNGVGPFDSLAHY